MRIVIDMQGAQTESRFRGIGRYVLSFAEAVCKHRGEHEIFLALNGLLPDSIDAIRTRFRTLIPQENIRVWQAPGPIRECNARNEAKLQVAELVYEAFIANLAPDIVHISSLFEGYIDDAAISIGRFNKEATVTVTLYDLIPLLNPQRYLEPDPQYRAFYERKIDLLNKSAAFLCISESAQVEGLTHLNPSTGEFFNISTGLDPKFKPVNVDEDEKRRIFNKFSIKSHFIFYTGGADERKNLPRLIEAFALLPESVKQEHQLVLAGKIADDIAHGLKQHASQLGVLSGQVSFIGYVSDEELITLYNLCKLFVFPSWHEGFGLPALEAMACGAPVVTSHNSSLPEVIGLPAAMFDPLDASAISSKILEVINHDDFRNLLRDHGIKQARLFTWDRTANRAITVWELLKNRLDSVPLHSPSSVSKPRLAIVSPMPPVRSGIADYTATLIPALAAHYKIDVVVAQSSVVTHELDGHCTIRDLKWFKENAFRLDRVIYQMGNSPFHQHMPELIKEIPGIVVLHDFFLSGLFAWQEIHNGKKGLWSQAIYHAHGFAALKTRIDDAEAAKSEYPANFEVLQHAQGVIVHSDYASELGQHFYGPRLTEDWKVIPLVRAQVGSFDKLAIRAKLGYAADDFIICSFGFLDATKLNHILIEAWHKSRLSRDMTCHLIFVGENHGGDYGSQLEGLIAGAHSSNPILITGFVSSEEFETYLQIADLGVQLRTRSRGETSAAILDCMNHALAVIVNANGSMSEIDPEAVLMLPDDFSIEMLSEAIEALWQNPSRRLALGEKAKTVINSRHNPSYCAAEYVYALEKFNSRAKTATPALIKSIVSEPDSSFFDSELLLLADDIAKSIPLARPSKCLFLDVTATCQNDLKTGIERVVRELLFASLETTVSDIRIEPVYLCNLNGQWHYRYARQYMLGLMQIPQDLLKDDIVDFQCGDTLLGLDLSGNTLVQAYKTGLFQRIRDIGVQVHFMVYDLLPVRMPERFPPGTDLSHTEWLKVIANFDGVICISKAVASDFASWRQEHLSQLSERPNFQIQWSHLGCDMIKNTKPFKPSSDFPKEFELFRNKVNFLMVGTIEPRKAYSQVIKAFGKLWQEGKDVNLIIVGREGWLGLPQNLRRDIPGTIELIRKHPELNKHLFWLNNLSDELLDGVYANSTALIAASYGEGFGLPLIEAAQHGLPLIVRDIDIFREVAGTNASYFSADSSDDVANAINLWLNRDPNNVQPTDNKIPLLTWQECATNIFTLCTPHVFEYKKTRLLFDISVTYRNDFKTGIQRVVRGVLSSLLKEKLDHIEVVPVLLNTGPDGKMVYKKVVLFAERDGSVVFDSGFSDFSQVIEPRHDDLLLGLDLAGSYVVQAFKEGLFYEFQSVGAKLYFMVHDLLPIRMPQHFSLADRQGFESWLDAIAHSDGVVCNSLSTAEDFKSWFANRSNSSNMLDREFKVMTFHLGADIENSSPTVGSPANAQLILSELMQSRTFLSVGTLEPRKGYQLVLDAFEILWQQGQEVTWVIVGKTGWMMENFCKRVTNHRLYGKNLFWFEGISDEFLGEIYRSSTCLIAASEGEGFGIPIVEAAQNDLPIIARNIPVFREIGQDNLFYFDSEDPESLAMSIQNWLALYYAGKQPKSTDIQFFTWQESTNELINQLYDVHVA